MASTQIQQTEQELNETTNNPAEFVDPNTSESEAAAADIVAHIQYTLGEMLYSYDNIEEIYDALSTDQFSDLMWLYQYYIELFLQGEAENLKQVIKDLFIEIQNSTDTLYSEKLVLEHKIFKNILFNTKQIFVLQNSDGKQTHNWVWKEMTPDDVYSLYDQQNQFYLGRISMSQKLQDSLSSLGMTIQNTTRGIANREHNVGYKYFIISSEPIGLQEYFGLLPQTRAAEQSFVDVFDEIAVDVPEFTPEDIYSYTYYSSRYMPQSEKQLMTLKNTKQNLTIQETDEMTTPSTISTVPTSTSGPTGY